MSAGIQGSTASMTSYITWVGSPTARPPMAYPSQSSLAISFMCQMRRSSKVAPWLMPKSICRGFTASGRALSRLCSATHRSSQRRVRSQEALAYS